MTISELTARFSSIEKIKKGGQKQVYKVKTTDGIQYALKIIADANDPRVMQEIEIIKELSLENVPSIIESGVVTDETIGEEVLYIIEEYIDGISLRDWLNQGNKATICFAFDLLYTLLSVLLELE